MSTAAAVFGQLAQLKPGETYEMTVRRDGQEVKAKNIIQEKEEVRQYVFQLDPQATPQQIQLREAWMKNL